MPFSAASDHGLHFLPMSHKKDARLKWVNVFWNVFGFIAVHWGLVT